MNNQTCPYCSIPLFERDGQKSCLMCGYDDSIKHASIQDSESPIPTPVVMESPVVASFDTPAAPVPELSGATPGQPSTKRRKYKVAVAVLAAVIIIGAGVFGYGETAAHQALKTAQTKLDSGQYSAALVSVNKVNDSIITGNTKKQLHTAKDKAVRWQHDKVLLAQAEKLLKDGKYQSSQRTLESIDHDFPEYARVKEALAGAVLYLALSQQSVQPESAPEPTSEATSQSQVATVPLYKPRSSTPISRSHTPSQPAPAPTPKPTSTPAAPSSPPPPSGGTVTVDNGPPPFTN